MLCYLRVTLSLSGSSVKYKHIFIKPAGFLVLSPVGGRLPFLEVTNWMPNSVALHCYFFGNLNP